MSLMRFAKSQCKYCIEIEISSDTSVFNAADDEPRVVYSIEGNNLDNLKAKVKEVLWESIELDYLFGFKIMDLTITKNGEYFDHEEIELFIKKVVRTSKPSKFIKLINGQKPRIFAVDRDKSKVEIIYN